jgi:pyruvate formate lyase activating enzyme
VLAKIAVDSSTITGTILHLQRLSTEDGPGIRTTVFYKGCPLCCAWCHNPESLLLKPQVQWIQNRCIGCGSCLEACEHQALSKSTAGIDRDRSVCVVCGDCARACPSGAMEVLGEETSVTALVEELLKDRAYFEKSGGGVTLSGGEPSLQPAFTLELIGQLKNTGISVALDTCGLCPPELLEKLIAGVDLVLFDLKLIEPEAHEKWTRVSNQRVLHNLQGVRDIISKANPAPRLWVRTPLIPGVTATHENVQGIGAYLAQHLNGSVERWELCAFNNLCRDKYERLGLTWEFDDTPLMTSADLAEVKSWAQTSGFDPDRAFVTGTARVEN